MGPFRLPFIRCGNVASILEINEKLERYFNTFCAAPESERKAPSYDTTKEVNNNIKGLCFIYSIYITFFLLTFHLWTIKRCQTTSCRSLSLRRLASKSKMCFKLIIILTKCPNKEMYRTTAHIIIIIIIIM